MTEATTIKKGYHFDDTLYHLPGHAKACVNESHDRLVHGRAVSSRQKDLNLIIANSVAYISVFPLSSLELPKTIDKDGF
jgi:hypothetical protein